VSVGAENIEFHGFCNMNKSLVDIHTEDAKDQYQKELNEIENQRYISKQYIEAKDRLARIACKSAMIYVGGNNTLEKKMNDDALDDAIHACQSTIAYGYTPGNNISIFQAIKETQLAIKHDKHLLAVGTTLYNSFMNVIYRIHANKNPNVSKDEVRKIVEESVSRNECYDLNTEKYSSDIINSARTDIEVLMSAITIIGTILSANQYLATEIQTNKSDK
jgi:chaperonin GroEL (HSP60 family)